MSNIKYNLAWKGGIALLMSHKGLGAPFTNVDQQSPQYLWVKPIVFMKTVIKNWSWSEKASIYVNITLSMTNLWKVSKIKELYLWHLLGDFLNPHKYA